jgi:hypothetical protein
VSRARNEWLAAIGAFAAIMVGIMILLVWWVG